MSKVRVKYCLPIFTRVLWCGCWRTKPG